MYLNNFKFLVGNPTIDFLDREKFMNVQYIKYVEEFINSIELGDNVAFLYAAGPAIHHSDSRNIKNLSPSSGIPIKSQIGYNVFNIARIIPSVNYSSSNANTCASSIYSIHEAKRLLKEGYTDVIVYAEEMSEPTLELLFKQLSIDITCTDGMAIIHLSNNKSDVEIEDTSWKWNADSSPMSVSEEGYTKVLKELYSDSVSFVKSHGTGTSRNDSSELGAINKFGTPDVISFKDKIGHTQGASGLIELCMLIESKMCTCKTGIVLASGLGGFYGGIRLNIKL